MEPITVGAIALGAVGATALVLRERKKVAAAKAAAGVSNLKSAEQLALELEAEKRRVSLLTPVQLAAVDAAAVPGKNVAAAEFRAETIITGLNPGDIIPTDRVLISVAAAGLDIGAIPNGSMLIRATQFSTANAVIGVIIDPRLPSDPNEHSFPISSVTGIGPVDPTIPT